ncbi:MAG: Outer membrane protein assembly factor BamB [Phycisphaerae bacterium]|nr:Outer membrane protein assembly factor BamB [Phycisphaerae bacterium]
MKSQAPSGVFVAALICALTAGALAEGPADWPSGTVGWRTDGTGNYPDAAPATEWGLDANVVWKTKLPSWSNATPAIVGGRIFITSEPDEVICLNAADGAILWRRALPLSDVWTEQERVVAEVKQAESADLKKQYAKLDNEVNEAYDAARKNPDKPELKKHFKDLLNEQKELRRKIATYAPWAPAQAEPNNGYTSATPVSDGRHVWVQLGTGVAACFDAEGKRLWAKFIAAPESEWGHSTSPVLADGKLLLHVKRLQAYEPLTGRLLWTAEDTTRSWGTPAITRVAGVTVAITSCGDVVRVSDGKVLAARIGSVEFCSPLVVGDVVCMIQNGGSALRLTPAPDDGVKVEKLWECAPVKERYYASPVCRDGLIYCINQRNHFSVIDAADGKVLSEQGRGVDLDLGKGTVYPSLVLAGDYLLVSSDTGVTMVFKPGTKAAPEPTPVATNRLERFRSTPVFVGSRMFVRSYENLYCFGPAGKADKP